MSDTNEPSVDAELAEYGPVDGASADAAATSASAPRKKPAGGGLGSVRWGLFAFLVLSVAVIILAAQNTQSVVVRALNWEAEAPLVVIILVAVVVTVVLDELVGWIYRRRRRKRTAEREELERLRSRT